MLNTNSSFPDDQLFAELPKANFASAETFRVFTSICSFFLPVVLPVVSRSVRLLVVESRRLRVGIVTRGITGPCLRNMVVGRVVGRVVGGTNLNLNDEHSTRGTWKDVALLEGEEGSVPSLARCPT